MGNPLPRLTEEAFTTRLLSSSGTRLSEDALRPGWQDLLWRHYEEMRRWNPRLSLVGPGTADEVVERHYAESLRALPLLPSAVEGRRAVLDIGTGGGFPGLVLAAARSDLDVVLVEPNQRKCAFLEAALRRLRASDPSLSCRVLSARVDGPVTDVAGPSGPGWPESVDVVTSRALAWNPQIHQSLLNRWPTARFLLWIGRELPELPSGASVQQEIPLGPRGRIVEIASR